MTACMMKLCPTCLAVFTYGSAELYPQQVPVACAGQRDPPTEQRCLHLPLGLGMQYSYTEQRLSGHTFITCNVYQTN